MIASGINIGRHRGEFERATRIMRSIEGGHRDPLESGVCEISKLADLYGRGAAKFCSQNKGGRHANGVPDERWLRNNPPDEAHAAGFTGRVLDPKLNYLFLCETRDATLNGGHVMVKVGGRLLAWCEPDLFAALGEKYRLTIKYDHTEPSLGAAVFNRELGSMNRHGFKLGEFLGVAEYAPNAPQIVTGFGLLSDEEELALSHKKRFDAQVRSEYRSIGVFGRRITKAGTYRDGRGNVLCRQTQQILTGGASDSKTGAAHPENTHRPTERIAAGQPFNDLRGAEGPGCREDQAVVSSPLPPSRRAPVEGRKIMNRFELLEDRAEAAANK